MSRKAGAGLLVGLAAAFVVAVGFVDLFGPAVFLARDTDAGWILYRAMLVAGAFSVTAGASVFAAVVFLVCSDASPEVDAPVPSLVLPWRASFVIAAAALAFGLVCRFAALERIPYPLWIDDVSLIRPALSLSGRPSDFADAIRPAPFGVARPYGTVGVLYLEAFRAALSTFGTTVFGVRFLAAAAGVVSVATTLLLARSLLPAGGGVLAALLFSGLRWNLIVSRWGWNAVLVGPIADVSALLLIGARRERRPSVAAAAGAVAGVATHVYLAGWCAGAALLGLAVWPREGLARSKRFVLGLAFAAAFAAVAAPLFLLREGRTVSYFARVSQQTEKLGQRAGGLWQAVASAADGLAAPWLLADPVPRHDVPGRSRLGWLLGIPVAVALGRALCRPEEETSGFFFCHAGAAFAASVASGGVPNGYRFCYLADVAAVAAASGLLLLTSRASPTHRRGAAFAAIGLAALSSVAGARDALLDWPERRSTFDGFRGQDTLLARAALRWERYGTVAAGPLPIDSPITFGAVVRYRLDPDAPDASSSRVGSGRRFRLAAPAANGLPSERRVETVRDAWGREWGIVWGAKVKATGTDRPAR